MDGLFHSKVMFQMEIPELELQLIQMSLPAVENLNPIFYPMTVHIFLSLLELLSPPIWRRFVLIPNFIFTNHVL